MGTNRRSPPVQHGELLYHHRRNFPMVKASLHAGRVASLRRLASTAAAEAPRWEFNRLGVQSWAPSPCVAGGGFMSHGVTVCTPRLQQ